MQNLMIAYLYFTMAIFGILVSIFVLIVLIFICILVYREIKNK